MDLIEDLLVDGSQQGMDYEQQDVSDGSDDVSFQDEFVLEVDVLNVPPDVPVVEAEPVLEQDFLDVPPIPPVVDQPDAYELTWHLTFRFWFPKAFATNVDLYVLDEMTVQTEDGFSMTLEMREETADGRIRYALRGWQNFMLQAGLEDGGQIVYYSVTTITIFIIVVYYSVYNTCSSKSFEYPIISFQIFRIFFRYFRYFPILWIFRYTKKNQN
ncbi:putative DNA-binding pseudobarrel domain superfamily [Helianthus annuus]|uniref:DNA-binding pseudobarrel domain superfamily n=1 Tax=Helianthus annuus TaxID=4232 RepID=A0A9K3E393_HELAN|nr:putative DNA-binding pseudobarrel domain superfamily [Helianthus annuus]KAJ0452666.1 putative DNA-binding pseudobarrel domain superfamily [Helianthus annuus]KAJ0474575.1 putative DNA-binding pseudobarrel domain superfamily [Helianthus annuus]KAJ0650132.1 putative DNA-binding pseudobarrel domain superfamily [Helianthus annuus]KAJ0653902.1 putative DNA-binding pseudobarrel domain superfamily [Helianthus annuus]